MAKQAAKPTTKRPATKTAPRKKTATAPAATGNSFVVWTKRNFKTLSWVALAAELIGTFALVMVYTTLQGSQIYVPLAYVILILVFLPLSGAHLNPILSIGSWVARRMSGFRAAGYVLAQVAGALLAMLVAGALVAPVTDPYTGQEASGLFTAQGLPEGDTAQWRVLGVEALGALIVAFGAASAFFSRRAPLARAFTIGGAYMIGLLLVQSTQILNPAIAVGAQALDFTREGLSAWGVYVLAPIVTGSLGMALFAWLHKRAEKEA